MGTTSQIRTRDHRSLSIHTLFGQEAALYRVNEKLYDRGLSSYGDIEALTEEEFWEVVGRVSLGNKEKIESILSDFPIAFRPGS